MAITEIEYGGRDELSMSQYEAFASIDDSVDYNIMDYPVNSITNTQMEFALTCVRLFKDGETFVCSDEGTYTKGHTYRLTVDSSDAKSWEDITPSGGGGGGSVDIDNSSITKNSSGQIQAVGLKKDTTTITAEEIWLACSIERTV